MWPAWLETLRAAIGVALHVRRRVASISGETIRCQIFQGQDAYSIGHGSFKEIAMKSGNLC